MSKCSSITEADQRQALGEGTYMKPTRIILGPKDAAYIVKANGDHSIEMPKFKPEDIIPQDSSTMQMLRVATFMYAKDDRAIEARRLIQKILDDKDFVDNAARQRH